MIKDDNLEIEYKFTIDEAMTSTSEVTKSASIFYRILPWIGILILLFLLFGWITEGISPVENLGALAGGIMLAILPFIIKLISRSNFKKNPNANTMIKYSISKDGLKIKGEGLDGSYTWDRIFKIEKHKKGFLIFPQARIAHWIPIKAISINEIEFFEKIIRESHIKYKS